MRRRSKAQLVLLVLLVAAALAGAPARWWSSGSELVGRTFWIGVVKGQPDDSSAIEGARFEIVHHDGTYRDVLGALRWTSAQPRVDGKPT